MRQGALLGAVPSGPAAAPSDSSDEDEEHKVSRPKPALAHPASVLRMGRTVGEYRLAWNQRCSTPLEQQLSQFVVFPIVSHAAWYSCLRCDCRTYKWSHCYSGVVSGFHSCGSVNFTLADTKQNLFRLSEFVSSKITEAVNQVCSPHLAVLCRSLSRSLRSLALSHPPSHPHAYSARPPTPISCTPIAPAGLTRPVRVRQPTQKPNFLEKRDARVPSDALQSQGHM